MQEVITQFVSHFWGAWRYRWLAIFVAWLISIGGWLWVWQMPDAYIANARIYVDTNSVLRPLLRGLAIQPNIDQRIAMMSRTLLSRPNLEKLMRMTDLDLEVENDADKEIMLSRLKKSIRLRGERGNSSLYSISVRDKDRETAMRIAQALITVFIESSLSQKRADSSGAGDFLDEQIAEYELRLTAAEERLAQFKQKNVGVLPGSSGGYFSRLQATKQQLAQAQLQLRELQNRKEQLQRQLDGEDPIFISSSVVGTSNMSPLDMRIQSLRVKLDALMSKYTDKHPEVRQIRGLIAELEAEKSAGYSQVREDTAAGFSGYSNSPVYQGMRSMLAETEANVAELLVRVAEYEERVTSLGLKVNHIPEIEAELKQLDRDYKVLSAQHTELLQRREAARLSEEVQLQASDVSFRVIDPPFAPGKPNQPDKPMLNAMALLFGLAGGSGLAVLISLLYPIITDPRTLANLTGLPLLGTVTLSQRTEERRREVYGLVSFASLTLVLLLSYVGLSLGQGLLST